MTPQTITLENASTRVDILPGLGGRVQHLVERRTGRDLLYVIAEDDAASADYLAATTGGWDLMFPNDNPWDGHPDHGRVWNASFDVRSASATEADLSLELPRPRVTVSRSFGLLDPPASGLRETIRIMAVDDTGPFLVAPHPMLAVEEGWQVQLPEGAHGIAADEVLPGRFEAGQALGAPEWKTACRVPDPAADLAEVIYVEGVRSGSLSDASGRPRVGVAWSDSLSHLWICTITGHRGNAFLLLEPCTARPYRLEEAIPAGTAVTLSAGEEWYGWIEVSALS